MEVSTPPFNSMPYRILWELTIYLLLARHNLLPQALRVFAHRILIYTEERMTSSQRRRFVREVMTCLKMKTCNNFFAYLIWEARVSPPIVSPKMGILTHHTCHPHPHPHPRITASVIIHLVHQAKLLSDGSSSRQP